MSNQKEQRAFFKSDVFAMIEEGVTKSKKSPAYNEQIGTFLTRMNISQTACNNMFRDNPDLEKAYLKKHRPKSTTKADVVIFADAGTPIQPVEPETVEPEISFEDMEEAEPEDLVSDAQIVGEDGLIG